MKECKLRRELSGRERYSSGVQNNNYIVAMSKEQTGTTSLASAVEINVVCASVSRDGRGRRRSRSALRCGVTLEAERVVLR